MKSIYIGVCKTRDDVRFRESFSRFSNEASSKYSICQMVVRDKFLPDAQNIIAESFLQSGSDYLLLLDDDHWGHTVEMLDCLVEANTHVATMKTYSRHYPYVTAIWRKVGNNCLLPIENGEGYQECDITGFPMTLIRKDVFDLLDRPYFRAEEFEGRKWNTDMNFFERLAEVGVKPIGCFQHCLNHDKITEDNVFEYRNKERFNNNNIAWFNILAGLRNQGA